MLWDTHMHCYFSGDSEADPADMIRAACDKGLGGICFTDHLDWDYSVEPGLFDLDISSYYKGISALRKTAPLPVRFGIELGLQPHLVERHNALTASLPFDFVIGSSHQCHGIDPYYPQFFEGRSEKEAYQDYFHSVLENIRSGADFDVYGHIDYVVRYGPNRNRDYTYAAYSDVLDEILRELIARGKGIEINTGGFKAGLGHPNPTGDIIRRYRELGGEIITIGADAHIPAHVAYEFDRVPGILNDAGFDYFTVFRERKPEFIKL